MRYFEQSRHVLEHTLVLLQLNVVLPVDVGEAPLARDNDLLATGELVLGAAESLKSEVTVCSVLAFGSRSGWQERHTRVTSADAHDDLANVDTGDSAIWLAPRATHAGLQTIDVISECVILAIDDERTDRHQRTTTSC